MFFLTRFLCADLARFPGCANMHLPDIVIIFFIFCSHEKTMKNGLNLAYLFLLRNNRCKIMLFFDFYV